MIKLASSILNAWDRHFCNSNEFHVDEMEFDVLSRDDIDATTIRE